jgi:hypothetical protein
MKCLLSTTLKVIPNYYLKLKDHDVIKKFKKLSTYISNLNQGKRRQMNWSFFIPDCASKPPFFLIILPNFQPKLAVKITSHDLSKKLI